MKKVIVICPNCGSAIEFKNWFDWILHTPFHWFGKRYTSCIYCGTKGYMKRKKD